MNSGISLSSVVLVLLMAISAINAGPGEQAALFKAVTSTTKEEKRLQSLLNHVRALYIQKLNEHNINVLIPGFSWDGAIKQREEVREQIAKELAPHFLQIKELDDALQEQYRREEILVRNLLASGKADVNLVDGHNRSPLYLAILHDKPGALIGLLLEGGANLFAENKEGQTPEELAGIYCLLDKDLHLPLESRIPRQFGDPVDVKRSCWISEALASRRHNAHGGSGAFFRWLSKGAEMLAFMFPSHRALSHALRSTSVQEMLGEVLESWEI